MKLLEDMLEHKISVNVVIFNMMMDLVFKEGRASEALKFGEGMSLFNVILENIEVSADVQTFNIMVDALCKEGMIKEAHKLLELMIQKGVKPDPVTLNSLMDGYCLQGDMRNAMEVFYSSGQEPNARTYNILINGYCKSKRLDEAFSHFRGMSKHKGLASDTITYSTLIGGLCKVGRVSDAKELFNEMQQNGSKPSIFTYGILIDGLCVRPGELQRLQSV
ncbi:hypothetical protein Sjap_018152 [Stephania japonica]|uniref:Pentatricopeptide repeat-containing protein n=1 Tax=Stephania japonica TaxID=461633 RepID=A0AAP0NJ22_9MAGN